MMCFFSVLSAFLSFKLIKLINIVIILSFEKLFDLRMFSLKYLFCLNFIFLTNFRYSCYNVISNHSDGLLHSSDFQVCNGPYEQVFKNITDYLRRPCLIKIPMGSFNNLTLFSY